MVSRAVARAEEHGSWREETLDPSGSPSDLVICFKGHIRPSVFHSFLPPLLAP